MQAWDTAVCGQAIASKREYAMFGLRSSLRGNVAG
jgi:hypothetical protein